ncbi:mitogen-activated protein kinase kinase kinase 7-like [Phoenix dactylifera]|uniref:Mitogen-activated protein kinase kinase kinase 7-like n=1 Tax=Phoenix dactylifera TaxID=42345 RepID=A0A8B7CGK4_PHODC|nr:mitogen-activated protein kinase kinase kinase 7-like [Phoenix dactylifera]
MEQFRQIGEVLGSLKALMVFRDEIHMNRRQCCLLVDAFNAAFEGIGDEIRHHLKFEEKVTKWKALEQPFKELHRIFREGEQYIRQCLEPKDWWGKAIALSQSTDCVEFHLHNLLWCIPVVLEAIERVGEMSGSDHEEIHKKRVVFSKKYEREWMEPKLFQHKFGKLYLVSQDVCSRLDSAWKEDRWILSEMIEEKRSSGLKLMTKQEQRLAELLMGPKGKLFATSVLVGSQDYYQVKRRFGSSNYKEVQWMGESFAVKHVIGEIEPLMNEISLLTSINHPNVMHCMYSFYDEEKKEGFLVLDLMSKDLSDHIKEICSSRRRIPFPLLVAVDVMLQIARGMEYLHSRKIHHGDLNPSNVLVRTRSYSPDGYLHVKITGFGLSPLKKSKVSANQSATMNSCIWCAPEVLLEQDLSGEAGSSKYTEKADVYSFGMICFELLTGKIPFEDNHLQGDKMSKNIRAGERPLFPFQCPKYLTSLTKRCWHANPSQRPSFSSLCRVLRYTKRFLIMNPNHDQPDPVVPPVDYFDIETSLSKRFTNWARKETIQVSEIPFQMYAYRVIEREKTSLNVKDKSSESGSEEASICEDENAFGTILTEDVLSPTIGSVRLLSQVTPDSNKKTLAKKANGRVIRQIGQHQKGKIVKPPQPSCGRGLRMSSESQMPTIAISPGRRTSGHVSD